MKIIEQFQSSQGEGLRTGILSFFIRVSECNLHCLTCDTKFSFKGGKEMSLSSILEKVPQHIHDVVLSGGEPILIKRKKELKELLTTLRFIGKYITIETNVTNFIEELIPLVDLWSLSPKLSCMSKKNACNIEVIRKYVESVNVTHIQLKFVLNYSVKDELISILDKIPMIQAKKIPIILQPMATDVKASQVKYIKSMSKVYIDLLKLAEELHMYNVRVLPQTHKIIWGSRKGV